MIRVRHDPRSLGRPRRERTFAFVNILRHGWFEVRAARNRGWIALAIINPSANQRTR